MSRWKASSIHLSISALIATAVLALMLLLWYPYPLFEAVGGRLVLLILLGVDVSLGPLITLIIFNSKKSRKALAFDLSVIALLQITALIYGMSVVFLARPVFVVFSKNSFDLVTANMLSDADIAKARYPEFRSLPLTGPVYVYTELPSGIKERNEVTFGAFSGKDLPQFPQYYQPYTEHGSAAAKAAKPVAQLRKLNPDHNDEIDDAVSHSGKTEAELGYLPLRAKYQHQAVLVEQNGGRVLKVLPMNPW
ncbi:MAG: TfpX/TfpZ family type IV pilin accessory protein [Pseudomonadota bacterium]